MASLEMLDNRLTRVANDVKWLKILIFGLYGLVASGIVAASYDGRKETPKEVVASYVHAK